MQLSLSTGYHSLFMPTLGQRCGRPCSKTTCSIWVCARPTTGNESATTTRSPSRSSAPLNTGPTTLAPSKTSTPPAPGSPPTCPGTTSSTATAASLCSPRHKSTAGLGRKAGTNATAPTRLTTTPTLNGSGDARAPQHPAPSSESTSPPKPNPTDSTQLDNDRRCPFGLDETMQRGATLARSAQLGVS